MGVTRTFAGYVFLQQHSSSLLFHESLELTTGRATRNVAWRCRNRSLGTCINQGQCDHESKSWWIICLYSIGWTQHVKFCICHNISKSHIIVIIFCKSITDILTSSGFLRLQHGPVPDMASFGNVMTALARGGGHWCQASALLDTMASQRIIGNVIIYGAFLSACEMAGYLWRTKKTEEKVAVDLRVVGQDMNTRYIIII